MELKASAPSPRVSVSYHTQHAPLGAHASFTVGRAGSRGGAEQSLGRPPGHQIFVGFAPSPGDDWRLLPFYEQRQQDAAAAFTGGSKRPPPGPPASLPPEAYERELGWATDTWRADRFTFRLLTAFDRTPDPDAATTHAGRRAFAPLIGVELTYDNRDGEAPARLLFGTGDSHQPQHPLTDTDPALVGFAVGTHHGFATNPGPDVELRQSFNLFDPAAQRQDHRGLHLLGAQAVLLFRVPPGTSVTHRIVLGWWQGGMVTTGLAARYLYTRWFRDLHSVLRYGLKHFERLVRTASARDRELAASALSPARRWLLAQATHSYFGSTQLLDHQGRALWIVNEGEYRMLNTFDLTVDHLFFELRWHPWAVRNVLDQFINRYAYADRHGLSFAHDMGVANQFSPPGHSSYECRDLHGCFSHMTMEQLVNWVCTALTYAEHSGDEHWLRRRAATLAAAVASLRARDAAREAERDGLLKRDSDRCGRGSEITTYDSLDTSLGQARNNLYLATKTLAAWWLIERVYRRWHAAPAARRARRACDRLAATLLARFDRALGGFPAVFEGDNRALILPAVEGFVFPLFLDEAGDLRSRYPGLLDAFRAHLRTSLQPGVCLTPAGGWQLSSSSTNTWMSKIFLAQYVIERLFPDVLPPDAGRADEVHLAWQQGEACGRFAFVDQVRSTDGTDLGSRYYPRGVTAQLWL